MSAEIPFASSDKLNPLKFGEQKGRLRKINNNARKSAKRGQKLGSMCSPAYVCIISASLPNTCTSSWCKSTASLCSSQSAFHTQGFQSSTPTSRHMGLFKIEISQSITKASLESGQGNYYLKDSLKRHLDSINLVSPGLKWL